MEPIDDLRVRQAPPVYSLEFDGPPFAGWRFLVFRHDAGGFYCTAYRPRGDVRRFFSSSISFNTKPQPSVREALDAGQALVEGFALELAGGQP